VGEKRSSRFEKDWAEKLGVAWVTWERRGRKGLPGATSWDVIVLGGPGKTVTDKKIVRESQQKIESGPKKRNGVRNGGGE